MRENTSPLTDKAGTIAHLSTVHRTRDNRIYNKECLALLEAGFDVTLVIRADADEDAPVPIRALPAPRNRIERLTLTQLRAWRELSRLRPGILHVHDPELIPLAVLWARTHKARAVFDAHENLVKQVSTKPYLKKWQRRIVRGYARALTRLADRRMDAIVAATPSIAEQFTNSRTVVVANYPWLRDFTAEPTPVQGRMVYTGDLTEERKLSFMIDVAHRVRERVSGAHLVLAGKQLAPADIDGDVVTHLGLLLPTEIPGVISSAQLGLIVLEPLPNYTTSLPTKLFEYMAAGVPFAASDFPFWRETFEPHEAGIFVNSADPESTANAIADLLSSPSACARLGRHGRAVVQHYFAFESQAHRLVELARQLQRLDSNG